MSHYSYFPESKIKHLKIETPFFIFSKKALLKNLKEYERLMPKSTEICYAMKANSEKHVLKALDDAGAGFEVASKYELAWLKDIKTSPKKIIYGTSVKPESHIKEFVRYGVDRFAFDSEAELMKLRKWAPGSRVYVRVHVNDHSNAVFNMSEKFGSTVEQAAPLLLKAREWGLQPYGISFNVGSQARNPRAWANGVKDVARIMKQLLKNDLRVEIVNFGGGFPHSYQRGDGFPSIKKIAEHIRVAVKQLPYPVSFIAEPGRGVVADTYVLVTSVIAKNVRPNGHWLYVDAGVYNALLESMTCQGSTNHYKELLGNKYLKSKKEHYILTGPTGDNIDVINNHELLPHDVKMGDKLLIYDVGAYTFTLMTRFNGFPKPKVIEL